MNKILLVFVVLFMLFGCSSQTVYVQNDSKFDVVENNEVYEDNPVWVSPQFVNLSGLSLQEIFDRIPDSYCNDFMREPVIVYDEVNYYMMTGNDPADGFQGPSYDYCEFTIFKAKDGDDVYAISKATVTPNLIFGGLEFLKYDQDGWRSVSEEILSDLDMDLLEERGEDSLKENRPDLYGQGLGSNYKIELPHEGVTVKFLQHATGEVIYELRWNGENFVSI